MTQSKLTYAETIRKQMKGLTGTSGTPFGIRDLSSATGYSYEHTRKLVNGEPIPSREMNDLVCEALGLDPEAMWFLAQREKIQRKFKDLPDVVVNTVPTELSEVWRALSEHNREVLAHVATALLAKQDRDGRRSPTPAPSDAQTVLMERGEGG